MDGPLFDGEWLVGRFVCVAGGCGPGRGVALAGGVVSGVGFRSVFGAAVVVQVDRGGGSFGDGDDVVVIAAVGRGGADRGGAGAVPEVDGVAEFAGRESAQLGDVEQVALVVGE